ncbi:MAG: hypothetical protein KHY83_09175 [Coriobacteriia bacterium]|nr:hypothetical protein [Coriobacteriia bacterium]MBS5478817.1 hypothetical protein [Coriobacteriia bacterium]
MEAIYSSTALQTQQREIKDIARKQVVHITENGNGAFVFCSEELFQQAIDEARIQAAEEARLSSIIERGEADFSAGRVYESLDAAFGEIEGRVAVRG